MEQPSTQSRDLLPHLSTNVTTRVSRQPRPVRLSCDADYRRSRNGQLWRAELAAGKLPANTEDRALRAVCRYPARERARSQGPSDPRRSGSTIRSAPGSSLAHGARRTLVSRGKAPRKATLTAAGRRRPEGAEADLRVSDVQAEVRADPEWPRGPPPSRTTSKEAVSGTSRCSSGLVAVATDSFARTRLAAQPVASPTRFRPIGGIRERPLPAGAFVVAGGRWSCPRVRAHRDGDGARMRPSARTCR